METADSSSNQISGGANSGGGAQFNQSTFTGPVNISHGASRTLPDRASTLPRTVNRRLYTGRNEIADRLANAFHAVTAPEEEQVKVFVIIGLGGTGKSEIGLKFAEDNVNRYWGRFWVDCSDHKNASESYKNLGRQCNWEALEVDEICWKLSSCGQRWLLILDNADEPNLDLQKYVPPGGKGDVIVTTRNGECSEHATVGTEILNGLDDKLSNELLLKVAGIQPPAYAVEADAAMQVVKILDRHTLALVQAGSYVRNGLCTLAEYPTLYEQQKKELMSYTKVQQKSSYNSVYATFEVSAQWLERESSSYSDNAQSSGDGIQLLHILSFMGRSGPMQFIFAQAAEYADTILKVADGSWDEETDEKTLESYHAEQLPGFAPQKRRGTSGYLRWRKACSMLKRFSLITVETSAQDEHLSLHPLVHEWAKERQNSHCRHRMWISTACVLGLACSGKSSYKPIFETVRNHVRSCVGQDVHEHICKMPRHAAWQMSWKLAMVLFFNHDDIILERLLQKLQNLVQEESRDGKMFLATEHLLALVKVRRGEPREAVKLLEHVVQVRESTLDEAHPGRLSSQHSLAEAYQANRQVVQAIKLLEHIVQVRESTLHEAHPDRLSSQHSLAEAYQANRQVVQAIKLLEHVVQVTESRFDEPRPERLPPQIALAMAYEANGQVVEAVELLEHIVQVKESTLDEAHRDRLSSQHALAKVYRANGRVAEAVKLLEHVVQVNESRLDESHPDRLTSLYALAITYAEDNQDERAFTTLDRTVPIADRKPGNRHPVVELVLKMILSPKDRR